MKIVWIQILALSLLCYHQKALSKSNPLHIITTNILSGKIQIEYHELPTPVKTYLSSDTWKGWKIMEPIYLVKIHNLEFYEVTLKNRSETRVLRIDAEGNDLR